jgi:hypothetical protein
MNRSIASTISFHQTYCHLRRLEEGEEEFDYCEMMRYLYYTSSVVR